ncbi:MAG TPA: VOC family protein [Saprospiraceae bacterium]|nr:VOC family protein [Saprospiraceae bacterium]
MKIKESSITIMVKDMGASIAFYQSLGVTLQDRCGYHYAQMTAPGIVIGIHPANDKEFNGSGNTSIGFSIDNIEEATALLKQLSIESKSSQDGGGQLITFADPDGTMLYFIKSNW